MGLARETYDVRQWEQGDKTQFTSLYETVFGERRTDGWFDWKFRDNPFVDRVPITVAVDGAGDLVGARPMFALPMAAGRERFLALQPCDAMVHPEHRRRGLFTRMTERAIERYDDHEAALFFNFPNEHSAAGNRKLGWRDVGNLRTYYRVQTTDEWVDPSWSAGTAAAAAADLAADGYLRVRDALAPSVDGVAVERYSEPPAELIAALYRSNPPAGFHAARTEAYVRWRYRNPRWTYRAYAVRSEDGRPLAAAVVGRTSSGGGTVVRLTDVVPPTADERALTALLRAVLSDGEDADVVAAPPCLDAETLSQFGFRSDTAPPLSLASSTTIHVARPAAVDPDDWSLLGRSVTDPGNWTLTFGEQDTS